MIRIRSCPKCGGDCFQEEDDYNDHHWACLQCGKRITLEEMEAIMENRKEVAKTGLPPVPPKPEPTGIRQTDRIAMHRYYVANREAILSDLAEMGQKKTMQRWGISSGSTISNIKHGFKARKPKADKAPRRVHVTETEQGRSPSDTKQRWRISSGGTISNIRRGFKARKPKADKAPRRVHVTETKQEELPSDTKVSKGNRFLHLGTFTVEEANELPAFPEFNDSWPELVQLRWLDTFKELARK